MVNKQKLEEFKQLVEVGYKVIKEEELGSKDKIEIKIRTPPLGTRGRIGTCINRHINNKYTIYIYATKPKYVPIYPEYKGKIYVDKNKPDVKLRRIIGDYRNIEEIKETLAHEIAHLKYWNHNSSHKSYTEYILELLNKELEVI